MARAINIHAARLNAEYEFKDGKLQTEAYLDPVGNWTGPGGVLVNLDGTRVKEGDRWTDEEALALYATRLDQYAAEVERLLPKGLVLNDNQFGALTVFCWNMGADVLDKSTMMEKLRQTPPRYEEAAAAFLLYRRATLWGGRPGPDGLPARDPEGNLLAAGVSWFKAMLGIYRRSAATALLFLSLDWAEATAKGRINLSKRPEWRPSEKRWVDVVVDATPWKEIYDAARSSPLPEIRKAEPVLIPDIRDQKYDVKVIDAPPAPTAAKPLTLPADWDRMTDEQKVAWLNTGQLEDLRKAAPPPAPGPKPPRPASKLPAEVPYGIADPNEVGLAPMQETSRYKGRKNADNGKEIAAIGGVLTGMAGMTAAAREVAGFFQDYDLRTLLLVGLSIGGLMITAGALRWWHGRNQEYAGQRDASQGMY